MNTNPTKEHHVKLSDLITRHDIDVLDHLDREASIPVLSGMQRQGDVLVIPAAMVTNLLAETPVPATGVPVVRGENGGNTHALVADGPVFCDIKTATIENLTLAIITVPEGSTAYLAHPEHGYSGIGPGSYVLRRQREQGEIQRLVAD
jgi:hypothetical protein